MAEQTTRYLVWKMKHGSRPCEEQPPDMTVVITSPAPPAELLTECESRKGWVTISEGHAALCSHHVLAFHKISGHLYCRGGFDLLFNGLTCFLKKNKHG